MGENELLEERETKRRTRRLRSLAGQRLEAEIALADDCTCTVSGEASFVDSGRVLSVDGSGVLQVPIEEIEEFTCDEKLFEANPELNVRTGVAFAKITLTSGILIRLKKTE